MSAQQLVPAPIAGLYENALYNAITIIKPLIANLRDETSQLLNIPVHADLSTDDALFSEVVISIAPGRVPLGMGKNIAKWDKDQRVLVYAARSMGATIWMRVKAQNHALRKYIIDALSAGILAGYILNADGTLEESAVLDQFIAVGIEPGELSEPAFPPPDLGDDRPEGQVYEAEMGLSCNIWLTWTATYPSLLNVKIHSEITDLVPPLNTFDTVRDTFIV